ncbi:hypothetical protein NPIL_133441 [Nephila pilipes]|uniref:Uncharacterized protein n=1 Tax=Nephila pilipes TaxID=299642 RepID=A0A8X6MX02_NEPPI|nr:hypothetical protein NPIL_133441 [Nephila pilipes]
MGLNGLDPGHISTSHQPGSPHPLRGLARCIIPPRLLQPHQVQAPSPPPDSPDQIILLRDLRSSSPPDKQPASITAKDRGVYRSGRCVRIHVNEPSRDDSIHRQFSSAQCIVCRSRWHNR